MLTARAQAVYDMLNGKPGITRIEGQQIRPIAGTNDPSEHSFGNAIDVYGSVDALVFWSDYFADNRTKHQIKVVCYDPGIGRRHDECTTKHTDHLHLDFGPHCGGKVATSGSPNELVSKCNQYQTQQGGTFAPDTPGGILGGLLQPLETILNRGLIIAVGVAIGIAGIVLVVKDTAVGQAITGAVKTATTKGLAK